MKLQISYLLIKRKKTHVQGPEMEIIYRLNLQNIPMWNKYSDMIFHFYISYFAGDAYI